MEFFFNLSIECITERFFYYLQASLLHRVVWMTWKFSQKKEIDVIKDLKMSGCKIALAGDGRFDRDVYSIK